MKKRFLIAAFIFFSFVSPALADRDANMVPADGFFLQKGDPKAGRDSFNRLKCGACHWVANDMEVPDPVTSKGGPMLGPKQAAYAPGWIADSIVSPSHVVLKDGDNDPGNEALSRMADFSQTMTVRELMDIVAYVQSLRQDEPSEAIPV